MRALCWARRNPPGSSSSLTRLRLRPSSLHFPSPSRPVSLLFPSQAHVCPSLSPRRALTTATASPSSSPLPPLLLRWDAGSRQQCQQQAAESINQHGFVVLTDVFNGAQLDQLCSYWVQETDR